MNPTDEINLGRRALEEIREVRIASDLIWDEPSRSWLLQLDVTPGIEPNPWIPDTSGIFLRIGEDYPYGRILAFPSKVTGWDRTFHHQLFNSADTGDQPYRDGEICLSLEQWTLGASAVGTEPYTSEERLYWRVKRLCDWLKSAASGRLTRDGEWYELPQFPGTWAGRGRIAYIEDHSSFLKWDGVGQMYGLARSVPLRSGVRLITEFTAQNGAPLMAPTTGHWIDRNSADLLGVWIRLSGPPVLPPYQAPSTWGELDEASSRCGSTSSDLFKRVYPSLGSKKGQLLLVGFPIPERVGGEPQRMHWQPIELPELEKPSRVARFRNPSVFHWRVARETWMQPDSEINWVGVENWSADQLTVRSPLEISPAGESMLLIGAGALGSLILNLLVRSGLHRGTIVDHDHVEAGNLVRHALTMEHVKTAKASALADWVNSISPYGKFDHIAGKLDASDVAQTAIANEASVILECTGDVQARHELSKFGLASPKLLVSVSMTANARHLLFYVEHRAKFSVEKYWELAGQLLHSDEVTGELIDLPRETGCWDARMPANPEDVSALAAISVRLLREYIAEPPGSPTMRIFTQSYSPVGTFVGYEERSGD